MPSRPKKPCTQPRCPELTGGGRCEKHAKQYQQQQDQRRGTAHERGYGSRWQKARQTFLARDPLCRHCKMEGFLVEASVVDHVIPHKGDQDLFWDTSNWQPLCKRHHDIKTVKEDGGFGR